MTQANQPQSIWGEVNGQPLKIPVIGVAGEHGSGKSTFISTIDPTRTCMVDAEESTVSYNLPFAQRYNLYEEMAAITGGKAFRPIQAFEWFRNLVENVIQPDVYTVLSLDPASDIEHGLVDWVKENHAQFGLTKSQLENMQGLLWGAVNEYWKAFIGILSRKVQTFAYTVHMGTVWKGGKPVEGKRKAKGKSSLKEVTSLFMTLDRSPQIINGQPVTPAAPTGLTLDPFGKSRLHHTQIDPDTGMVLGIQPILPPQVPNCTPQAIRQYIAQPPDWANLKPEEQYTERPLTDREKQEREDERQQTELEIETARLTRAQLLASAGQAQAQQLQGQQPQGQRPAVADPVQQAPQQLPAQPAPQQPPQPTPEQQQAQQQAQQKVRQQQQEKVAADARKAMANPTTAGKEVGPGAVPQQPAPQPTQQPAPQPPPQQQAAVAEPPRQQAAPVNQAVAAKECIALFGKMGFDGAKARAKIQEYNPEATTLKDLSDEQVTSLHGFLSDALAIEHGAQGQTAGN